MADIKGLLNNTILIPEHDSLVDSNQLPDYDVPGKIDSLKKPEKNYDDNFIANLKINTGASVKMIAIQEVDGFGMTRENEKKVGVTHDYVINLPGPVSYSDVTIKHLFTKDQFFLDWLTSGVAQGGSPRVDMELHVAPKSDKKMVFTLYDAFPIAWSLDELDPMKSSNALVETVRITYSWVSFKIVPA